MKFRFKTPSIYRNDTSNHRSLRLGGDDWSHSQNIFSKKLCRMQSFCFVFWGFFCSVFFWCLFLFLCCCQVWNSLPYLNCPVCIFVWCEYFPRPLIENLGHSPSEGFRVPEFTSSSFAIRLIHFSKLHFSHLQNDYNSNT